MSHFVRLPQQCWFCGPGFVVLLCVGLIWLDSFVYWTCDQREDVLIVLDRLIIHTQCDTVCDTVRHSETSSQCDKRIVKWSDCCVDWSPHNILLANKIQICGQENLCSSQDTESWFFDTGVHISNEGVEKFLTGDSEVELSNWEPQLRGGWSRRYKRRSWAGRQCEPDPRPRRS